MVTVEFDAESTDMTLLRLNLGLLPEDAARSHGAGWTTMLDRRGNVIGCRRLRAAAHRASRGR